MTDTSKKYLIVGLGVSGMSVVRYLSRLGVSFEVLESSVERYQQQLQQESALSGVQCHSAALSAELLCSFDCVVVSPGVSVRTEAFNQARAAGVDVIGDVELFARAVSKPVLAITGSNGKSTVVSMAGELLNAARVNTAVIGNVGFACLDSLNDDSIDAYVLELSSFQLETTSSLKPVVASVLNVSADHLDRYQGFDDYAEVKRRIYRNAEHAVFNLDDEMTFPDVNVAGRSSFSAANQEADWSIVGSLLSGGELAEVPVDDVKVAGIHNSINALAAMAMTSVLIDADKDQLSEIFSSALRALTACLIARVWCVSRVKSVGSMTQKGPTSGRPSVLYRACLLRWF